MSSTIILSRPLGPKELLTTLAIAWVASTAAESAYCFHASMRF